MFMFSWLRAYTLAIYSPLAGLNFNIGAEKAQEEWQPPLLCDSMRLHQQTFNYLSSLLPL
jgi:hypothetical protein